MQCESQKRYTIYVYGIINVFVILPFFLVNFVQIILADKARRTILCLNVLHPWVGESIMPIHVQVSIAAFVCMSTFRKV